jgi:hypothetical protein
MSAYGAGQLFGLLIVVGIVRDVMKKRGGRDDPKD